MGDVASSVLEETRWEVALLQKVALDLLLVFGDVLVEVGLLSEARCALAARVHRIF
jgi:hypothetical protein